MTLQKTFSDIKRYPRLKVYEGLKGKIPLRYPSVYMGIEVEMEGLREIYAGSIPPSFKVVPDGSLKVHGMEAVTVPIKLEFLEIELTRLFSDIAPVFSRRTSIHVHMNARDFSLEELSKFLILYSIFERALYKYSGDRWNNNYCVPLYQYRFYVVKCLQRCLFGHIPDSWSKYHGINIIPLWGQDGISDRIGTIEFRQMIGNKDIPHIVDWCNLITCLKFSAKKMDIKDIVERIISMGTNDSKWIEAIFKQWSPLITRDVNFYRDLANCTSSTKLMLEESGYVGGLLSFTDYVPRPSFSPFPTSF